MQLNIFVYPIGLKDLANSSLLFVLVLIVFLFCLPLARANASSLCTSDEKNLFTCTIGKRLVSVCSSKELSQNSGYVQYRFGAKGKELELVYPVEKVHPSTQFSYGETGGAKSSLENLFFMRTGYSYTLYRESATFDANGSGIRVKTPDGKSIRLKCKEDSPPSELYDLNNLGLRQLPGESFITSETYETWPAESPNADLLVGVRNHDFNLVKWALEKGADVNFRGDEYELGVLGAVADGRSAAIRLNKIASFDDETDRLITLLIDRGASPTMTSKNGNTVVTRLADELPRAARRLLDVGWPNDYNYRMYIGILLRDEILVKEGLNHGVSPNQSIAGWRHLGAAISMAKQLDKAKQQQSLVILELLLKGGAKIDEGKPGEGGGDIVRAYSANGEEVRPVLDLLIRYATPAARGNSLHWAKIWNKEPYLQQQSNLVWFIKRLEQP